MVLPAALSKLLNLPNDLLNGDVKCITHLASDLTDSLGSIFEIKDALIFGTGDATNPLVELISDLGRDLQTVPILTIDNGTGCCLTASSGN